MTREKYLQRMNELELELIDLRQQYINFNKPYEIGQKLKIDGVDSVVGGFRIEYNGEITPICYKLKKDGTAHTARSYIWHNSKVELI